MLATGHIVRSRRVTGPRLRRPLFSGTARSPLAVTDNHGRAGWISMGAAQKRFPGPHRVYGGIVVGEAYRVDQNKVAKERFDPENPKSWGKGGNAPVLIDPCREDPTHSPVIVGSGEYKTTTAISTLLHWTGSAVVLDPAGEIAPMLRKARAAMNHKVYELDPATNVGFNVLDWIDTKSPMSSINIDSVVTWVCGDQKPGLNKKLNLSTVFDGRTARTEHGI